MFYTANTKHKLLGRERLKWKVVSVFSRRSTEFSCAPNENEPNAPAVKTVLSVALLSHAARCRRHHFHCAHRFYRFSSRRMRLPVRSSTYCTHTPHRFIHTAQYPRHIRAQMQDTNRCRLREISFKRIWLNIKEKTKCSSRVFQNDNNGEKW